ncbi:MAG: GNAT family N-acetyltransferase [Candidatus Hodarchaeota archaeon]
MKILEYDEVDPMEVLLLNLLGLDYPLTPKRVKLIRQYDARPFQFFALYAIIEGVIAGQVGVFRLPMVSTEGPEDVGGIWAVCTLPSFKRQGVASRLMKEAHERMRAEGLRFSSLGTSRYRVAYSLYLKWGYQDVFSSASMLIQRQALIKHNHSLTAEQGDSEQISLTDDLFRKVSANCFGFARRFEPFIPAMVAIREIAMGKIGEKNVWLLWEDNELVGYLIVKDSESVLKIVDMLLTKDVDPISAIASLTRKYSTPYLQIQSNQPSITESLSKTGARVVPQDWSTFMIKPLTAEVMNIDIKDFFGVGTDRFLFSWMDST